MIILGASEGCEAVRGFGDLVGGKRWLEGVWCVDRRIDGVCERSSNQHVIARKEQENQRFKPLHVRGFITVHIEVTVCQQAEPFRIGFNTSSCV